MVITLPLPFRVAAGILATGIDLVRSLPDDIPAIPVTLAGNAMRLSMKVHQEIAMLAIRGDELLGGVIGAPRENPAWAKFDDDPPMTPAPAPKPASTATRPKIAEGVNGVARADNPPAPATKVKDGKSATLASPVVANGAADRAAAAEDNTGEPSLKTPAASAIPPGTTIAMEAALAVPPATVELATEASATPTETTPTDATPTDATPGSTTTSLPDNPESAFPADVRPDTPDTPDTGPTEHPDAQRAEAPATEPTGLAQGPADEDGPSALPGYDRMTLAQVRGHLRELAADDVSVLLRYEQDGDNRAPFLTLLTNRLVTLEAQNS